MIWSLTGRNNSPGKRHTLTLPSMYWRLNRDLSDHAMLNDSWSNHDFLKPSIEAILDVNFSTEAHELDALYSFISKSIRSSVWPEIILPGPALYSNVSRCSVSIIFLTKRESLRRHFYLITCGLSTAWCLLRISPSFILFT